MANQQQVQRGTQVSKADHRHDSDLYLNDLVSLPIIITDFDAEHSNGNSSEASSAQSNTPSKQTNSETSSVTSSAMEQNWTTGFSDFADEVWKSMTSTMRTKLREAAVEVLKRTDDAKTGDDAEGALWNAWDDDARFLD